MTVVNSLCRQWVRLRVERLFTKRGLGNSNPRASGRTVGLPKVIRKDVVFTHQG